MEMVEENRCPKCYGETCQVILAQNTLKLYFKVCRNSVSCQEGGPNVKAEGSPDCDIYKLRKDFYHNLN